jgi:LacI family transcriptional regulator
MHRRSKITMADVARAAGVSKQTVSAVINNKSGISEETRVRIRRIVARLDYHPNLLAGSLRAQRSVTVGALIPSITNPFNPELVRGIEDEAQRNGYRFFYATRMKTQKRRSSTSTCCAVIESPD